MFRKGLTLLLIFSLALNFAFAGIWVYHWFYVRPRLFGRPPGPPRVRFERSPWRALALTGEQRRRVPEQHRMFLHELRGIQTAVGRKRRRLLDLLEAPEPDVEAIRTCQQEIAAARRRASQLMVNHLMAIKRNLNLQQQKKLMEMLRRKVQGLRTGAKRTRLPNRTGGPRDPAIPREGEGKSRSRGGTGDVEP